VIKVIYTSLLIFFALFALAAQALPPDEAGALPALNKSPRHAEWVSVDAGGGDKLSLWVVYPEVPNKAPVVLVVHEIFGLSDWARSVADSLAAEGFIAVAPDLLSGKGPGGKGSSSMTVDQARTVNSALELGEVYRRLDAAAKYATALPSANGKFGIVGFCWGGGVSFGYATKQPTLGASVVFYGVPPASKDMAAISAPALGFYGGDDARITSTVAGTAQDMKGLGKSYESAIFDGAGHAFMRQQDGKAGANLKAAQAAWPRTIRFLKSSLDRAALSWSGAAPAGFAVRGILDDCCDDDALD
jgi:carboxymethylenebutenolidase